MQLNFLLLLLVANEYFRQHWHPNRSKTLLHGNPSCGGDGRGLNIWQCVTVYIHLFNVSFLLLATAPLTGAVL